VLCAASYFCYWKLAKARSSRKGTSFEPFLHGLSGFFLAFLHKRNGVPSVETAPKGILQEYEGILQELTA
jgi:hypothetical protein